MNQLKGQLRNVVSLNNSKEECGEVKMEETKVVSQMLMSVIELAEGVYEGVAEEAEAAMDFI